MTIRCLFTAATRRARCSARPLYTGGTFTAIGQLSGYGRPNATVLLDDGAAYGTVSAGDGTQLFTWKSGQALTPLGAPVTGTTSTQMTVIGVNASGEALVSVGGQNSSGITVTTHWLYRAGLWNEVKPSSGYTFAATSMNGVADSGRILAEEFSASTYAPHIGNSAPRSTVVRGGFGRIGGFRGFSGS